MMSQKLHGYVAEESFPRNLAVTKRSYQRHRETTGTDSGRDPLTLIGIGMTLRSSVSALALVLIAACSGGSDIASPGSTAPTTPPSSGGGGTGGGTGGGSGASCPAGFTAGVAVAGLTTCDVAGGTLLADLTLPFVDGVAYRLDGRVNVGVDVGADALASNGAAATLTIEPGVTLFGESGADFLVVNRGSRLIADGTVSQPIIMTSRADLERRADADASNDLGVNNDGEWGGLVILGRAPNNRCITGNAFGTNSCENAIEGVSNPQAIYGGDQSGDDSGILRYLQVRFAGFEVSAGNELNGISFGGVGDGTVVDYVQVYNNSDDGVEFFGGTVNASHLVLVGNDDESIDTDNGYQGRIQYVVVSQTAGRGDNVTEQSSVPAANGVLPSNPLIANFAFIGTDGDEAFKSNSGSIGRLINGVISYDNACIDWDATAGNGDNTAFAGAGTDPSFHSVFFDCGRSGVGLTDDDPETPAAVSAVAADANNVFPGTNTLSAGYFNGTAESAVTPFDAAPLGFESAAYIGPFGPTETPTNNWATGWTFGLFNDPTCPAGTLDSGTDKNGQNVCEISGTLTTDLRLTRGNIYELSGRVNVGIDTGADGTDPNGDPAVLTIEAGVTLFGNSGADFMVVNRGSQILANGTAANPIIFTSEADLDGTQPNAAAADGEWGGLVILGMAPNNRCITGTAYGTVSCENAIEGVSNPQAIYGGATPTDSSGSLRYVQVKYAGFEVSAGNELNGISFGGVGSGTTVQYVQVHNNSDDGVEFFGGNVNVKHLVLTGNDDESIDTDNGYQGNIQFVIVSQTAGRGDNITEQSSVPAATGTLSSNPTIVNFTFVGTDGDEAFKSNSGSIGRLVNGVISYENACIDWDATAGDGDSSTYSGVATDPTFNSVLFDCGTNGAGLTDDSPETPAAVDAVAADANNSTTIANTLIQGFINGTAEAAVTPFDETTLDPFFTDVDYIGAVENANDTWWQGWSCGLEASDPC